MIDFRLPILVVADDLEARRGLCRMLLAVGFANLIQDDGSRALALLQQHAFWLVLSDMEKTPHRGLALLRAVRETPALAHLCFVMATAVADTQWVRAAGEAGVDGYLLKPFELDQLRRVLLRGATATARARRTIRAPLRDDRPMMPIREDAVQLYHVYGHLEAPPGGELPPWETAFMEWRRFMHRRELLVALRSHRRGGQFTR
jgi:two-component system chemotaxis response regulator CheY